MLQAFANIFRIPELRSRVFFTLGMLAIYRIGFWIPLPGVDQTQLAEAARKAAEGTTTSAWSVIANYAAIFSGGSLQQSTIFGLGIMPYISAAIIFQLLQSVWPTLKKLKEEGARGYQKIQEWTRYATVGLCLIQGFAWLSFIRGQGFVYSEWANQPVWWVMGIAALTAGTVFLMWLGEQIDKPRHRQRHLADHHGRHPHRHARRHPGSAELRHPHLDGHDMVLGDAADGIEPTMSLMGVMILLAAFVIVVAGAVLITVAQRRIPIQQAKHTRGRKVSAGSGSYLPLRVNHGGVMPIIFASSLMIFPSVIFGPDRHDAGGDGGRRRRLVAATADWFAQRSTSISARSPTSSRDLLIYFFAYFWITVQFNPEEIAKQLRDHGSFIPGLRPGPRTAEYLETVMERITYVGAAFLAVIAAMPLIVMRAMNIPFNVTQFLGGTGLLIVVAVDAGPHPAHRGQPPDAQLRRLPRGAPVRDGDRRYPCGVETRRLGDGWTIVAADGSPAVHVEETIAITRSGCVVLTAA
jgi:preprotein translocase subunit SecY